VEIFDGADWVSVAGSSGAVSLLDATELSVKYALTLG
jgi:N-acetylmuramic acid 6-phosphate (MurNAc-6-P) etherase